MFSHEQYQPSTFQRFNLRPEEQAAGLVFSGTQLAVLHNLRTDVAEEKLNLPFTPNDVLSYAQQEAHLAGQLSILSYLISAAQTQPQEN